MKLISNKRLKNLSGRMISQIFSFISVFSRQNTVLKPLFLVQSSNIFVLSDFLILNKLVNNKFFNHEI